MASTRNHVHLTFSLSVSHAVRSRRSLAHYSCMRATITSPCVTHDTLIRTYSCCQHRGSMHCHPCIRSCSIVPSAFATGHSRGLAVGVRYASHALLCAHLIRVKLKGKAQWRGRSSHRPSRCPLARMAQQLRPPQRRAGSAALPRASDALRAVASPCVPPRAACALRGPRRPHTPNRREWSAR